jgi:hypothetical protein
MRVLKHTIKTILILKGISFFFKRVLSYQKSRTDPGNHNTILAAVRVLVIKGRLIPQVTLMSSAKK